MGPEQQIPNQKPSYDFILQTPEPEKKSFSDKLNKKALFIALGIILALILVGMVTLIDAQRKAAEVQVDRLISIAQMQTEISRVSDLGIEKAEDEDTRSRAQAINDSIDASLQQTLDLLKARGVTPDDDVLNQTADTEVDSTLEKTIEFKQFDRSFEKVIDALLVDYQQLLLQANKGGNAEEQAVIESQYDEANSMLGLVDQADEPAQSEEPSESEETTSDEPAEEPAEE